MQARANWRTDEAAGVGGIAPERLVFIDESAVLTSMVRRYGRSPRGQRAYAKPNFNTKIYIYVSFQSFGRRTMFLSTTSLSLVRKTI